MPEDFYQKKYNLSAPHSEVREVIKFISQGDALDLGCGRGRNSVFLQTQGFNVTSCDRAEKSLNVLKKIRASDEVFSTLSIETYDIETAAVEDDYDLIISTVVLQFLQPATVAAVIGNLQQHTRPRGYNLIVAPALSKDFKCGIDFPFFFAENQLREFYQHWTICKYVEAVGEFHRKDENGNFFQSNFATLLAQKPG